MGELDVQRIVQPELGAEPGERLGIGALAHHRLHRIARRDVEQEEGEREHAEQRGDERARAGRGGSGSPRRGPAARRSSAGR